MALAVAAQEGFQPATFRSSRSERGQAAAQSVEDFLDDDEREERNRTVLTVKASPGRRARATATAAAADSGCCMLYQQTEYVACESLAGSLLS
jgi:hypothetical protein